jgi:threonine dehydrogenase-like Zn-dependent dehydrogenase
MGLYGHGKKTKYGGCAEFGLVPLTALYKLKHPDKIPARIGALMEPFGVAHNAISEPTEAPISGDTVTVLGAGPIGVFVAAIAKALGAAKVIVVDILDTRLAMAERMGATVTLNSSALSPDDIRDKILEETDGVGTGVLIECTGAPPLVNKCFSFMRKGGRAVLVGLPKAPLHVENVLGDFLFRAITVKSIHGRRMFSTWSACEELLATGTVDLSPVITHEYPLSQFQEAFDVLLSGKACKVVMLPGQ